MKELKYKVNGADYTVCINSVTGNQALVTVNGVAYNVEMQNTPVVAPVAPAQQPAPAPAPAPKVEAPAPAPAPKAEAPKPEAPKVAPAATGEGTPLKSPLPGIINDIKVAVGDTVKNGQVLLILEAMKMENEITAEADGTITSIAVNKGDNVMEGAVLLTIA